MSWDNVVSQPPAFDRIVKRTEGRTPIGMKKVSAAKQDEQLAPLHDLAAQGKIPVDQQLAQSIGRTMERQYKKMRTTK